MLDRRRRAFVMAYAVGTLVLVSSLALSMVESTSSDLEIAKLRTWQAMARINAESGIEYALGFITRELGKDFDLATGIDGGPWRDPSYNFRDPDNTWYWSLEQRTPNPLLAGFTTYNSQAEGPPVTLHRIPGGAPGQIVQISQFQIALAPTPTYANVRLQTVGPPSEPTVFVIRSRGEILADPDGPAGPLTQAVLGSAYATQTFGVPNPTPPADCERPRPLRQVFDRQPASLTPQGLLTPNPH